MSVQSPFLYIGHSYLSKKLVSFSIPCIHISSKIACRASATLNTSFPSFHAKSYLWSSSFHIFWRILSKPATFLFGRLFMAFLTSSLEMDCFISLFWSLIILLVIPFKTFWIFLLCISLVNRLSFFYSSL